MTARASTSAQIVASAYLSVHEAALLARVHPDRVAHLARPKPWGLRVSTADLQAFVARHEFASQPGTRWPAVAKPRR
jgi:hypothetical protein